jgi:hypothetical protein
MAERKSSGKALPHLETAPKLLPNSEVAFPIISPKLLRT